MQRTSFEGVACSVARTVDVVGEPWSLLVLRDVYAGLRRFNEIQASLGISRKVLADRLAHLTDAGVLARQQYADRPPRHEYVLTPAGTEVVDVLMVMVAWGDKWRAGPDGPPVLYRHTSCGHVSHVELRCADCAEPMGATNVELLPGPGGAG